MPVLAICQILKNVFPREKFFRIRVFVSQRFKPMSFYPLLTHPPASSNVFNSHVLHLRILSAVNRFLNGASFSPFSVLYICVSWVIFH